jgi:hypothetical protein
MLFNLPHGRGRGTARRRPTPRPARRAACAALLGLGRAVPAVPAYPARGHRRGKADWRHSPPAAEFGEGGGETSNASERAGRRAGLRHCWRRLLATSDQPEATRQPRTHCRATGTAVPCRGWRAAKVSGHTPCADTLVESGLMLRDGNNAIPQLGRANVPVPNRAPARRASRLRHTERAYYFARRLATENGMNSVLRSTATKAAMRQGVDPRVVVACRLPGRWYPAA